MVAFINLVGQRFGRLVVLNTYKSENKRIRWECRCDCGNVKFYISGNLRKGNTLSCGCYHRDRTREVSLKHDMSHTKAHRAWCHLRERCDNPEDKAFHNYGGRGIKYCERWKVFENFYADMGEPPSPAHSIDRYPNNDGNYEPENCRWATRQEQADNCRHTIFFDTPWGRLTAKELSKRCGLSAAILKRRRSKGLQGSALWQ